MKTTLAILASLTLSTVAMAQTPTTAKSERPERLNYSMRELERSLKTYQPMPVYVHDSNGRIRVYNTQAEADRAEKKIREERDSLQKSIKENQKVYEKQAEERSNKAMLKLVAFGAGLFIGVMRIIWGVIAG